MLSLDQLLKNARSDVAIITLPDEAKRGAEAYLQAYQYVAENNPSETAHELREMAAIYLEVTASPALSQAEESGAVQARETLKQLQAQQ